MNIKSLSRIGHGANDVYWFILPTILPLILREHGFSYAAAGGFITMFLCIIALLSFLIGTLADRVSRSFLLIAGFFIASASLLIAGSASSFGAFLVFVFLAAIGVSSYHPVIYAVIDEGIATHRGTMYAHFELFGAAGVVALLVFNGLLVERVGWKNIVLVACAPGLIAASLFILNRSKFKKRPNAILGDADSKESFTQSQEIDGDSLTHEYLDKAYARNLFVVFLVSIALRTLTATAILNFMPTFLVLGAGLDVSLGAFAAGLVFVGAIAVSTFVGGIADRWGAHKVLLTASLSAGVFLFLSTYATSAWSLPISLIVLGASISGALPAQNLILSTLSRKGRKGTTFGTLMGVMTIANSLGPLALGVLADRIGLHLTYRLAALPVLISCALVAFVSRKMRDTSLRPTS